MVKQERTATSKEKIRKERTLHGMYDKGKTHTEMREKEKNAEDWRARKTSRKKKLNHKNYCKHVYFLAVTLRYIRFFRTAKCTQLTHETRQTNGISKLHVFYSMSMYKPTVGAQQQNKRMKSAHNSLEIAKNNLKLSFACFARIP